MHILIDALAANRGNTGLVTWLVGLMRGIRELPGRDRWTLVGTRRLDSRVAAAAADAGVAVRQSGPGDVYSRAVLQQLVLPHWARRHNVDVLLASATVVAVWGRRIPTVSVLHDFRHLHESSRYGRVQLRYRHLMYRYAVHRASQLIAISEATAADATAIDPSAADRLRTVHHGCDHVHEWPRFEQKGTHGLAFAHLENKEPAISIRSWGRLRTALPDFNRELHLVGVPDGHREVLSRIAVDEGVGDLVRQHGFLPPARFAELFSTSAVLLMPSSAEGMGFPVLEAMALGVPVIASDLPALHEAGGQSALYASPGDPEAFARACRRVFEDELLREQLIQGAKRHAARFTWLRAAEQLRMALAEALA